MWCRHCEILLRHTYTSKGSRRYRYYVCPEAKDSKTDGCQAGSLPAAELEAFVWDEVAEQIGLPDRQTLTQAEQIERFHQHVQRIEFDGHTGDLSIELNQTLEETA